jgi:hypothetical protein
LGQLLTFSAVEQHENNELVVELWEKGMTSGEELIDKISIPLEEFKFANNGNIFNHWYTLEGGHGAVHLDIEYNFHYAKVFQTIQTLSNSLVHPLCCI